MINRAIEMLEVAKGYIQSNDLVYGTYHYDSAECDGECVAEDCGFAVEELQAQLDRFDWNRVKELARGATPGPGEVETLCLKLLSMRG